MLIRRIGIRLTLLMMLAAAAAAAQNAFPALLSEQPAEEHRAELMLFGQFVGDWNFDGFEYHNDGTHPTQKGEIQFRWVLQGTAIQDVWLESERSDSAAKMYGTTLRFYDARTNAWRVTWIEPRLGVVAGLKGQKIGDEIVMVGLSADGSPIRWIFSEIKPDSFRWHGEKLVGNDWRTYEELRARRKK